MSPLIRCETMWTSSPRRARNEASAKFARSCPPVVTNAAETSSHGGVPFAPRDRREEGMWPVVSGSMMLRPCSRIEHLYGVTWCELRVVRGKRTRRKSGTLTGILEKSHCTLADESSIGCAGQCHRFRVTPDRFAEVSGVRDHRHPERQQRQGGRAAGGDSVRYGWIITSHRRSCGATASGRRTPVACTRSAACGRVAMNDVLNASLSRPINRTRACVCRRTTSMAGASSAVTSDVCVPKWPTVCPAPMRSRAIRSEPTCSEAMRSEAMRSSLVTCLWVGRSGAGTGSHSTGTREGTYRRTLPFQADVLSQTRVAPRLAMSSMIRCTSDTAR